MMILKNIFTRQRIYPSKRLFSTLKQYSVQKSGSQFSYRVHLKENGKVISPWHGVKLRGDQSQRSIVRSVLQINTQMLEKMEVVLKEQNNPIKQDTKVKNGKEILRNYPINTVFNYGMLPKTWENQNLQDKVTKFKGDNDPLDLVEIGKSNYPTGTVIECRILGALCMIDQGELDWKILALNLEQSNEKNVILTQHVKLNLQIMTLDDVKKVYPGKIQQIRQWFRMYKTYDGKPENKFGYNEEWLNEKQACDIIQENQKEYEKLISGQTKNEWGFFLPAH